MLSCTTVLQHEVIGISVAYQGFCYVKYSSPEVATTVIENLDGIEYPQGSGLRLKVIVAYPLRRKVKDISVAYPVCISTFYSTLSRSCMQPRKKVWVWQLPES